MTLKLMLVAAMFCMGLSTAGATIAAAQTPPAQAPAAPGVATPDDAQAKAIEAAKRWAACSGDAEKLCATEIAEKVKGGVGRCLDTHIAELSETCKASRIEHAARIKAKAAP